MAAQTRSALLSWTVLMPAIAVVCVPLTAGRDLGPVMVALIAALLGSAVLAAVHHAEVVAHRVGEPYGTLVLAIAITVIEVGLIVTLMLAGGPATASLARDTVFAAVMITCNGMVGLSLLLGALRKGLVVFNAEGSGAAFAMVARWRRSGLVLPTFTTSNPGPEFSTSQLAFAAMTSLVFYGMFVPTQTGRHRDFFLPVAAAGDGSADEEHAAAALRGRDPDQPRVAAGLAGGGGRAREGGVAGDRGAAAIAVGLPQSFVGVVIALLVLLPETIAAGRSRTAQAHQISLNLAFGSAMASIGLTIPAIAVASIWLQGPLELGLEPTQIVLFALTVVVGVLTVVPGRATLLQAGVHLALLAAYLFLAVNP